MGLVLTGVLTGGRNRGAYNMQGAQRRRLLVVGPYQTIGASKELHYYHDSRHFARNGQTAGLRFSAEPAGRRHSQLMRLMGPMSRSYPIP